jgi:hypothetical protein
MEGEMDIALSLVAIVILILSVLLFRRTKATTKNRPPRPSGLGKAKPDPLFHAVSLEYSGDACEAAKAVEGKRFLSTAAPHLPLPECDRAACNCHFNHHKDRRAGGERRKRYRKSIVGESGGPIKEQRHRGDRRNNDPDDFFA